MFNFLLSCFHFFSIFVFSSTHPFIVKHHYITKPIPSIIVVASPSPTIIPTITLARTSTATVTPFIISTQNPTQMPTQKRIISITPTIIPSPTVTPTIILSPTITPLPKIKISPALLLSPTPSITSTPTPVLISSLTITPSPTPSITSTPTPVLISSLTITPSPTILLSPTTSLTVTPTASPTPTLSITPVPTPTPTKIGNDISYPQCGKTYPTGQGFGIVGINDGIATTINPCLTSELNWANLSVGTLNQAKVQIYVNTGNPGGLNTPSWPKNNTDPVGNIAPNPYGTCDGSNSVSCSWQYGWNRAVDDVQKKFIPAIQSTLLSQTPSSYPWWLDVETVNSWESGTDIAYQSNLADLEAMVSYFKSIGITVGIYSTSYQWNSILSSVPSGSNLNGLNSWLPGAQDLNGAQSNCHLSPLTSNGKVIMTQYTDNNFDYDYSCI